MSAGGFTGGEGAGLGVRRRAADEGGDDDGARERATSGAEEVTFMSVSCPKVNTCTAVGNYYSGATGRVPLVERYS